MIDTKPCKMENNQIIIYQTEDGETSIDVAIDQKTVWLSQSQMIELFQSSKQNISLHINNIFNEGELMREATVKESLTVQNEGKRAVKRKIEQYSLDVIISVGYRVKSKRGTQFRIWANKILKEYLVKGYSLNEKRLHEQSQQFEALKQTVKLMSNVLEAQELWFLEKNSILYREDGTKRIADNALVALTLMIAESKPDEKDIIAQVVVNLINGYN